MHSKTSLYLLGILLLTSCGPSLYLTDSRTNQVSEIKVRKVNALITKQGEVHTGDISMKNGSFYSAITPVEWSSLMAMEYRVTTFSDVIAAPLEITGLGLGVLGGAIVYLTFVSAEDSDEGSVSDFITGLIIGGFGVGLNRLGHMMRPPDKKAIKTIYLKHYQISELSD